MATWGPSISYDQACAKYQSLGPLDWDYLPAVMDSRMTHEYVVHCIVHRFPRLTRLDEPELVLDEDDERLRCRAPR